MLFRITRVAGGTRHRALPAWVLLESRLNPSSIPLEIPAPDARVVLPQPIDDTEIAPLSRAAKIPQKPRRCVVCGYPTLDGFLSIY